QKISIRTGADSVELTKKDGQWVITSGLGAGETSPAEFAAVDDLLKALKDLKATGFEPAELPNFGFSKPRSIVEVSCEGKMEPERITIGDATPSKTGAYVRNDREGFVAVVKAEAVNALVVQPIDFLSREMMRFNREMASRLDLVFPKYTVTAQKEGATWRLLSPVQGVAESGAVSALLNDLTMLRGRRVVGRAGDAKRFGLESPTVKISVSVDNPPRPKATPSTQPTSGPTPPELESVPPTVLTASLTRIGDKTYAMTEGGKVICEIDGKVLDDALAELLETKLASIDPAQASKLIYSGTENFSFEKSGDGWKLAGEPSFSVDPAKITEVFTTLSGLKAKEFTRYTGAKLAEFGLNAPATTITAQTSDLNSTTLRLSTQGPSSGGKYACLTAQLDRVFVLKQEDVDKLTKKVKDFQKAG
ncbi:MAG TPA: DUF4340 domain-containing protein, partial [Phycisphaerae bacterium]|nr:DUF4340 domain-containing protein [Phycisphaerae bacterium]